MEQSLVFSREPYIIDSIVYKIKRSTELPLRDSASSNGIASKIEFQLRSNLAVGILTARRELEM